MSIGKATKRLILCVVFSLSLALSLTLTHTHTHTCVDTSRGSCAETLSTLPSSPPFVYLSLSASFNKASL